MLLLELKKDIGIIIYDSIKYVKKPKKIGSLKYPVRLLCDYLTY